MSEHPLIQKMINEEPEIGKSDKSECVISWTEAACRRFEEGDGWNMDHHHVKCLLHTLIETRQRVRRLVKERDDARQEIVDLKYEIQNIVEQN